MSTPIRSEEVEFEVFRQFNALRDTPQIARRYELALKALRLNTSDTVLDVGCGAGFLSEKIPPLLASDGRVVGIDIRNYDLDRARERISRLGFGQIKPQYLLGDVHDLPLQDMSFRKAVSIQTLSYVSDIHRALKEVHRVLDRHGTFVIVDTDWTTISVSSRLPRLSTQVLDAYMSSFPNPNFPRLAPALLLQNGFCVEGIHIETVVSNAIDNFSMWLLLLIAKTAEKHGVSQEEVDLWRKDLSSLNKAGSFNLTMTQYVIVTKNL